MPDLSCRRCKGYLSAKRADLGYLDCMECGDPIARRLAVANSRAVVTLHKGNSIYLGTGPGAKDHARHVAQMRKGTGGEH